jgi:hypothetical protein
MLLMNIKIFYFLYRLYLYFHLAVKHVLMFCLSKLLIFGTIKYVSSEIQQNHVWRLKLPEQG